MAEPTATSELRALIEKADVFHRPTGGTADMVEKMIGDMARHAVHAQDHLFRTMRAEQSQGRDPRSSPLVTEAAANSATWEQVLLIVLRHLYPTAQQSRVMFETMRLKNMLIAQYREVGP